MFECLVPATIYEWYTNRNETKAIVQDLQVHFDPLLAMWMLLAYKDACVMLHEDFTMHELSAKLILKTAEVERLRH